MTEQVRETARVKNGFSKADLAAALGERYEWRGNELGGKGRLLVTRAGLDRREAGDRRLLLLCKEHSPSDCHRHQTIAVPLAAEGVVVLHIFENEVIESPDLQAAIDTDDAYEYEDLADVIAEARPTSPPADSPPA